MTKIIGFSDASASKKGSKKVQKPGFWTPKMTKNHSNRLSNGFQKWLNNHFLGSKNDPKTIVIAYQMGFQKGPKTRFLGPQNDEKPKDSGIKWVSERSKNRFCLARARGDAPLK